MKQTVAYPIGDRLYLNITDRCTLTCTFCPKHNGSWQVHTHDLALDHRPELDEILATIGDPTRFREVVFCGYGEPTLRLRLLLTIAEHIKATGVPVRINTDGLDIRVEKIEVIEKRAAVSPSSSADT